MIPTAFSGIALDTLGLKFRDMTWETGSNGPAPDPGPTLDYLERLDSDALAQDIAQMISQLRYFSLDLSEATAQRSDPVEYWSVRENSESSTCLKRISRLEGVRGAYLGILPSNSFETYLGCILDLNVCRRLLNFAL